jgi:hypothetical protein
MSVIIPFPLDWPTSDGNLLFWAQVFVLWIASAYLVAPFDEEMPVRRPPALLTYDSAAESDTPPEVEASDTQSIVESEPLQSGKSFRNLLTSPHCWIPVAALLSVSVWSGGFRAIYVGLMLSMMYVCVILLRTHGTETLARPFRADVFGDAAYEIAAFIAAGVASALMVGGQNLYPIRGLFGIGPEIARVIAATLSSGLLVLLIRGGDIIIEQILSQVGVLPTSVAAQFIGGSETARDRLRHGRLIGYTERIIIASVVATGHYDALGFIIAAKGFIRFGEKQYERPEAEYFLVGTLASICLAVVVGMLLRVVYLSFWALPHIEAINAPQILFAPR